MGAAGHRDRRARRHHVEHGRHVGGVVAEVVRRLDVGAVGLGRRPRGDGHRRAEQRIVVGEDRGQAAPHVGPVDLEPLVLDGADRPAELDQAADVGVHLLADLLEEVAVVGGHEHRPQPSPGGLVVGGEARIDPVDDGAGAGQRGGGPLDRLGDRRVDVPAAEVDREAEAEAGEVPGRAAPPRSSGPGIERMSASSGPWVAARKRRASSTLRASGPWWEIVSNRPGRMSIGIRPSDGLSPTMPHHEAGMRTEPPMSEPSARATQPDATAARAAARRAAGRAGEVVGVAGRAPQRAVGLQRVGELGRRRLPDDDGAGPAQRGDDVGVALGHPALEGERAERGDVPGRRRGVLDGHGDAVERSEVVAPGDGGRGLGRLGLGPRRPHRGEAVELGLDLADAGQRVLDQLDRRALAAGHRGGEVPCRRRVRWRDEVHRTDRTSNGVTRSRARVARGGSGDPGGRRRSRWARSRRRRDARPGHRGR